MTSTWEYISHIGTPYLFLAMAVMIKCLLISFYALLLYGVTGAVKKLLAGRMSAHAVYYSWYALLLSFPLSGLWWNDAVKLPLYEKFFSASATGAFRVVALIWLAVVWYQLLVQIIVSFKIRMSIRRMEAFPDRSDLKLRAAQAVGLRAERIDVVISDYIRSPVSYGVFKKLILLPQDYDSRYTDSELYLLLLHEMLHIKNYDTVKLHVIGYAECFIWLLRLFGRAFRRDSEILCDNRVISIQEDARNTYGELLVKECAGKRVVKGFAFSDSYHMLRSRLDALYAFKPEMHRRAVFSVAVFAVLLLAFCWSYQHHADWFYINDAYNSDFDVYVVYEDTAYGEFIMVPEGNLQSGGEAIELVEMVEESTASVWGPDVFDEVYEVSDGWIRVDKVALYEAAKTFEREDTPVAEVVIQSMNYTMDTKLSSTETFTNYTFAIEELADADESSRYFTQPLDPRGVEEMIYLLIAHWI